jgi:hypothetical protein
MQRVSDATQTLAHARKAPEAVTGAMLEFVPALSVLGFTFLRPTYKISRQGCNSEWANGH